MAEAKLLTSAANYAVVHLPERAFPGIVVQGDSFHAILRDIEDALGDPIEGKAILSDLLERLRAVQANYERVLDEHGLTRPY